MLLSRFIASFPSATVSQVLESLASPVADAQSRPCPTLPLLPPFEEKGEIDSRPPCPIPVGITPNPGRNLECRLVDLDLVGRSEASIASLGCLMLA